MNASFVFRTTHVHTHMLCKELKISYYLEIGKKTSVWLGYVCNNFPRLSCESTSLWKQVY